MVWAIIIILLSAADQLLKLVIKMNLSSTDKLTVIDRFFYIINRKNPGAAWSFLADKPWGLYALAGTSSVITIVILFIIFKNKNIKLKAFLSIICAGSIGNLIDRIRDGGVTDYLDFHFGSYIFPTFNLADMLVVCGTILLCLLLLLDHSILSSFPPTGKSAKPDQKKEDPPHAANHSD